MLELFDNIIKPSLRRKCKNAVSLQTKLNDLSDEIEQEFTNNYSSDDVEEMLNVCEAYASSKDAEEIKKIHKKYAKYSELSPKEILYIDIKYKVNIKRLREDGGIKYNQFVTSINSDVKEA